MIDRYELRRDDHPRYPLAIVESATGAVVGRYYETSEGSARAHAAKLNGRECRAVIEPPDDSALTVREAVARAREIGDPSPGSGWRRLLWRMADLLESDQ